MDRLPRILSSVSDFSSHFSSTAIKDYIIRPFVVDVADFCNLLMSLVILRFFVLFLIIKSLSC